MYGPATGPTPSYTPPTAPSTMAGSYGFPPDAASYSAWPTTPYGWLGHDYALAPARPSAAARVGLFLLRAFLSCLPIMSIGMLCWVPLLRTAFVRRRPVDWVVLAVTFLLCVLGFYLIASTPDTDNGKSDAGLVLMLLLSVTSTVYFLATELRRRPLPEPFPQPAGYAPYGPLAPHWSSIPVPTPTPTPTPTPAPTPIVPLVPLGQVQAELDELSALLRRHERPAP